MAVALLMAAQQAHLETMAHHQVMVLLAMAHQDTAHQDHQTITEEWALPDHVTAAIMTAVAVIPGIAQVIVLKTHGTALRTEYLMPGTV